MALCNVSAGQSAVESLRSSWVAQLVNASFMIDFAYSASFINASFNNTSFNVSCLLLFVLLLFSMRRFNACCNAVLG